MDSLTRKVRVKTRRVLYNDNNKKTRRDPKLVIRGSNHSGYPDDVRLKILERFS